MVNPIAYSLTLFAIVLISHTSAWAQTRQAGACPSFAEPAIVVQSVFTTPRYDFTRTIDKLQAIAALESAATLHHDKPAGLSVGELSIGMEMNANATYGGDGRVCARPAHINITVGLQKNTVYVARELPRRSCGHNEVLAHEEKHVAIDRQLLKEYKPIIEAYMNAAARQLGTVRAKTTTEAEHTMQAFINDHLQDMANRMNAERTARQSAHDSPEEYSRLGHVCDGSIARALAIKTNDATASTVKRSSYGYYPSRTPQRASHTADHKTR